MTSERESGGWSFLEVLAATAERGAQMLEELLQLGIAIGSDGALLRPRPDRDAGAPVHGGRGCDVFLREGAYLRFAVVQNEVTARRLGERDMQHRSSGCPGRAEPRRHVANSGEILNIPKPTTSP